MMYAIIIESFDDPGERLALRTDRPLFVSATDPYGAGEKLKKLLSDAYGVVADAVSFSFPDNSGMVEATITYERLWERQFVLLRGTIVPVVETTSLDTSC